MEFKEINKYFFKFKDRAERLDDDKIQSTFVDVGPVIDILSSENSQILYGRRGVGKTHALRYLGNLQAEDGGLPIYLDLSNLGSDSSIYTDQRLDLPERATRLLIDVVTEISNKFLQALTDDKGPINFEIAQECFADLKGSISDVKVTGETTRSERKLDKNDDDRSADIKASLGEVEGGFSKSTTQSNEIEFSRSSTGIEQYHIEFGRLRRAVNSLLSLMPSTRVWLMLDEWSSIPLDLQPYLADLIRRTFLRSPQVTIKIGAIEHRSRFYLDDQNNSYIGFETGADISAAINLDNYLVFDNDPERATDFFKVLLTKHLEAAFEEDSIVNFTASDAMQKAFAQETSFNEFVRATEGVPRDAMHLLSGAAQKAWERAISVDTIRRAALEFYQTDKLSNIEENKEARDMLQFINEKVISHRQTRAFLISVNKTDKVIDYLFDRRLLHILDQSKSAAHRPGERFRVYKIDYGCYVDLANTDRYPSGLLFQGMDEEQELKEVPQDDGRSFRRAILDIDEFYRLRSQPNFLPHKI